MVIQARNLFQEVSSYNQLWVTQNYTVLEDYHQFSNMSAPDLCILLLLLFLGSGQVLFFIYFRHISFFCNAYRLTDEIYH